jgi:hypothetical protein
LKIVASGDICDLGPKEGTAISYYWNPIYNVLGVLPWLLLILAFVLFRENRKPQALWIVVPVVLLRLLWAGFAAMMKVPSESAVLFVALVDCLLIAFVLNWLLAERIGNRNRLVTWFLSVLVFAAALGVTLINIGLGTEAIQISLFIGLTVGILMLSFPLAVFLCRKKFGPVRFSLWMAVWVLLTTSAFFCVFVMIQSALSGFSLMQVLPQVVMVTLIYAGILIVGLLPFEILWFNNSFWRKRFEAVFGIQTQRAAETVKPFEPDMSVSG